MSIFDEKNKNYEEYELSTESKEKITEGVLEHFKNLPATSKSELDDRRIGRMKKNNRIMRKVALAAVSIGVSVAMIIGVIVYNNGNKKDNRRVIKRADISGKSIEDRITLANSTIFDLISPHGCKTYVYTNQYEEISGQTVEGDNQVLKETESECYDSAGNLKDGYEVKKIQATNSEDYIEVAGKNFVRISASQTKVNSDDTLVFYFDYGITEEESEKRDEDYMSYDYVYFVRGTSLYRIKCNPEFNVCVDKSREYDSIEEVDGKIKYCSAFENIVDDKDENLPRFNDKNIVDKDSNSDDIYINLKNGNEVVGRAYPLNKKAYIFYDEDCDEKDADLYYIDKSNELHRIKDVGFKTSRYSIYSSYRAYYGNILDTGKLMVDKDYKDEVIASGIDEFEFEVSIEKELKTSANIDEDCNIVLHTGGYFYGGEERILWVDKKHKIIDEDAIEPFDVKDMAEKASIREQEEKDGEQEALEKTKEQVKNLSVMQYEEGEDLNYYKAFADGISFETDYIGDYEIKMDMETTRFLIKGKNDREYVEIPNLRYEYDDIYTNGKYIYYLEDYLFKFNMETKECTYYDVKNDSAVVENGYFELSAIDGGIIYFNCSTGDQNAETGDYYNMNNYIYAYDIISGEFKLLAEDRELSEAFDNYIITIRRYGHEMTEDNSDLINEYETYICKYIDGELKEIKDIGDFSSLSYAKTPNNNIIYFEVYKKLDENKMPDKSKLTIVSFDKDTEELKEVITLDSVDFVQDDGYVELKKIDDKSCVVGVWSKKKNKQLKFKYTFATKKVEEITKRK